MSANTATRGPARRLGAGAILLLVVASLGPYALLPPKPFISDSLRAIVENPVVREGSVRDLLTHDFWGVRARAHWATRSYRPVVTLSWALQIRLFGERPWVFHLTDMALHASGTLLLALVLLELGTRRRAAVAAASLFAVHPVLSEAVCSTVGRADLVASVAMLGGLLLHLRARRASRPLWPETGAVVLGAVALLSKEYAVIYPFLLAGADLALAAAGRAPRRPQRREIAAWIASGLVLAAYLALRWQLFGALGGVPMIGAGDHPLYGKPLVVRWATAAWLLVHAGRLVVFPAGLNYFHSAGSLSIADGLLDPRALAGMALVAAIAAGALYALRRHREPRPAIGALLFLLPLAPSLNTVSLAGVLFAERFLYLPLAGVALALAAGLDPLERHWRRVVPAVAVVALVLAAATADRVEDWSSTERLARASLPWYPNGSLLWIELGLAQGARGDHEAAAASFEKSLSVVPNRPFVWRQYAVALMNLGRFDEAIEAWRRALDLSPPDLGPLWRGLGTAQLAAGRIEEAVRSLQTAHRLLPDDAPTRARLAEALLRLAEQRIERGATDEAADFASRAVALGVLDPERTFRAALVLDRAGRHDSARTLFDRVLAADPDLLERRHRLAVALDERGRHLDAARAFAEILAARPDHAPTLFNLGRSLLLAGRARDAIAPLERGLALRDDPAARRLLAEARARARRARSGG
ncbi:MAG: hypothetical protein Kow0062_10320 [Acidobacteriota bacterium]